MCFKMSNLLKRSSFAAVFLIVIFTFYGSCSENVTKFERILNGDRSKHNQFPYMLALENDITQFCGAVAIGRNWALTAAHCVANEDVNKLEVRGGTLHRNYDGTVHAVETVIYPSSYDPHTLEDDIAILEIYPPFHKKESVKFIDLPRQDERVAPGTRATVMGWGEVNDYIPASRQLLYTTVKVLSNRYCTELPSFNDLTITSDMLCAGAEGTDSTKGDSGGPLVVKGKHGTKLIGIVSWGDGSGSLSSPGIYTRVSRYRTWIKKHTKI